jgi:hypothetical protein
MPGLTPGTETDSDDEEPPIPLALVIGAMIEEMYFQVDPIEPIEDLAEGFEDMPDLIEDGEEVNDVGEIQEVPNIVAEVEEIPDDVVEIEEASNTELEINILQPCIVPPPQLSSQEETARIIEETYYLYDDDIVEDSGSGESTDIEPYTVDQYNFHYQDSSIENLIDCHHLPCYVDNDQEYQNEVINISQSSSENESTNTEYYGIPMGDNGSRQDFIMLYNWARHNYDTPPNWIKKQGDHHWMNQDQHTGYYHPNSYINCGQGVCCHKH